MTTDQSKQPQLSVLIPAIPSRKEKAQQLYDRMVSLAGDMNIEVLMFMDNRKRTIGEKRDALKNISNGKYFMLVDDDDDLVSLQEIYDATFLGVDVITFKQKCTNSDNSEYIVTFGLGNEVEHNTKDNGMYTDIKRPPFHVCAWHERFKIFSYPAQNFAEDWGFVEKAIQAANTEHFIDKVLHHYNFSPSQTTVTPDMAAMERGELVGAIDLELIHTDSNEVEAIVEKNEKKYAIVNLITNGSTRYLTGQNRLIESMKKFCPENVDCFYFRGEDSVGAPSHSENPYAFKLYAIKKVKDMGYDNVLWLDASVVAVGDFMSIFEWVEKNDVFMEHSGWMAGQWTNDNALSLLGVSRIRAWNIPMFSAGFTGINFNSQTGSAFFKNWWAAMMFGAFKGSWEDHRHDMSAGSIVAYKMNLHRLYSKDGQFFSYIGAGFTPNPNSPFQLIGL